ncbi:alpha-amylase family glycosyl hydrolase [Haloferula sp. A504]|uniref:alpha-amylase family glycosyl hydrolase n=1 Tax=Haloferula sp. A504 TaxID=3373601 RepID=UPI0031C5297E|nr:alpha-amylase family glycosyl hydrolase [Verrucomicrobiaceae bacterium E54]
MISRSRNCCVLLAAWLLSLVGPLHGEAMLQYFNTSWAEVAAKMPEIAEAGYSSLWLPPPTKASGGLSVGYDCWDRFDLGSKDQRGSIRTRYGTEAELLELVRVAHRFGIRVYFDNVMNHNAFDVPGFNAFTPIDIYPGFLPEDFHLRRTEEGFYRKWDNTRDWNDAWQVQNLGLSDLIDIATEPGTLNYNHGAYEGDTIPKFAFVRHPDNPEYYCYIPTAPGQKHSNGEGNYVGFGPGNGITVQTIADNPSFYSELVEDMLHRSARWKMDRTKADGLRLDAVKHTPADFYGATFGADKDSSNYGYMGQIQAQFNLTRGFSDWDNHRDSVFNTEQGRDDAMLFGEHLGQPPAYGSYIDAGMRLIDNDLRSNFNNLLGNPSAGLNGFDQPGSGGFPVSVAVMHAQSHDNDFAARRELQHAFYFTREGLGLVYTDGNYHAETLGESGGAFPRHANTSFLGQWGDTRLPNLATLHQEFARGYQVGRWSDGDFVAYERIDKRENGGMNDSDGVTMLIMLNDNYAAGQSRPLSTSFRATPLAGSDNDPNTGDEYLYQYARGYGSQTGFYTYASNLGSVVVDPGSYFIFAPRTPEESDLWRNAGGAPLTIYQNGEPAGTVEVERRDGPDGDPGFNPYGLPDPVTDDFSYTISLPRVTSASDLDFVARTDGSAENILFKLDGGIDLNGTVPPGNADPFLRDNPPAVSTDVFLGYEQPTFVRRMHVEKFAAVDTTRCQLGAPGAETYIKTIGSGSVSVVNGPVGANDFSDDGGNRAQFLYHDPSAVVGGTPGGGWPGGSAPLQYVENGSTISLWAKPNAVGGGFRMFCYYTTDGSNPEGAGGRGTGSTGVVEMNYSHDESGADWWMTATLPQPANGEELRYKIGIFKENAGSIYPSSQASVDRKKQMLTEFKVEGFNPSTITYSPHNDYNSTATGLDEGFHMLRARAFLRRDGKASLYHTFQQTFYYDAERPGGEIVFPANNGDTVGGSEYGVVVRADASTSSVWYRITDGDASNDDSVTTADNGNGAWVQATEVTPSPAITPSDPSYRREFRFNYVNIPSTGTATIEVRLRELSSSEDDLLSDVDGHFTTLTRTVNTAGPDLRMFVAFPPSDGTVIDESYVVKAYFSKSLADGLSEQDLKGRFLVRYGGNESWPASAQVLDPAGLSIIYDETSDYHALAFSLPNLYNGIPEFLHRIEVTHDRPDPLADLVATRRVQAAESTAPRVSIIQPQEFDSNGRRVEIVLPDGPGADSLDYTVRVDTDADTTSVNLSFLLGSGTLTPVDADENTPEIDPVIQGSSAFWDFIWTITEPGQYRLQAVATSPGGTAEDIRNATVIRRQLVEADDGDLDDDDDGLADFDEGTLLPLPNGFSLGEDGYKPNPEDWVNGDVHIHFASGQSNPFMPDTDGDGLPDGLEVGWRTPGPDTNTASDTNGDGRPNFIGDLDPPFYNTLDNLGSVPGVNSASEGGDRARQLFGSMTNPGNPDTDGDGLRDGIEDANANGWVDGDGAPLGTTESPTLARSWPNGRIDAGETWLETSPNDSDTDDDELSDGFGEDTDFNGGITGDTNANRVWETGEVWTETDPLNSDTDGDGLPDGWERRFGLNPLDNGIDAFDGTTPDPDNGGGGDPDGDGLTNLQELAAGTDPTVDNSIVLEPGEAVVIGPVSEDDAIIRGAVSNRQEFTDWKIDDLVVLDTFEGDGSGNQGGDTYLGFDGFDSSRDIVAFYARDGGATSVGGTGEFYFRVDFHDLRPFAEEGNLDLYVVIDTGNPAVGEYALPDEVDTGTTMRWEAVVAVYQSNAGAVLVDTNPADNTTSINEDLTGKGVQRRDQNTANGFGKAYFDSRLDAVEFSISRQALKDAGWLEDPSTLNFQVFTTRDGTQNDGTGAGDIGGRTDIRDTIYDDYLAEDYWRDQGFIGQNSELRSWFGYNGPDKGRRTKVIMLAHGNQALSPGSEIQDRINPAVDTAQIASGEVGGWSRLLDAHDAFGAKLGLHLTPTLAAAAQWASVDPAANKPWRDGPAFNQRIGAMAADGTIELIASTFADAPLSYYDSSWLVDNVALSNRTLQSIYGVAPSSRVFWIPERVIDEDVLSKVSSLGYTHVFVDQFRHILDRFGRQAALLDDGYRINRINGVDAIVINDQASTFRFRNTDNGLDINLRQLISRKARSGEQHQLIVFYSDLSDFGSAGQATAYDRNLAWLASRPWVELVGPEQVASGQVDLSLPPDGGGDNFAVIDRGTTTFGRKLGPLWLDHATQGNYDFWYFGSGQEESLRDKVFEVRPGVNVNPPGDAFYGVQDFGGSGSGLADASWNAVSGLPDNRLGRLARGTYHASTFLAGWHDEDNNDLRTYSTGDFIYPDTTFDFLAGFSKRAQAQTRMAARYAAVAAWAAAPPATTEVASEDVDLDGEPEYILRNDRVFAIFEAMGGRCVGAWRLAANGDIVQMVGNPLSHPSFETEEEGAGNRNPDGTVLARRTSAFKDWFANGSGGGSSAYVNQLYTPVAATNGWAFTSGDGAISKTITLANGADALVADYALTGPVDKLFVRFGLSPDLDDLLVRGQEGLSIGNAGGGVEVTNTTPDLLSRSTVGLDSNVAWQSAAVDDDDAFDTVAMRNQSQVQQVEVESLATSFTVSLALDVGVLDGDLDGLPYDWEQANGLDDGDATGDNGPDGDPDGDGVRNYDEWLVGLNPQIKDADQFPRLGMTRDGGGLDISFPSLPDRVYQLEFSSDLNAWDDYGAPVSTEGAGGPGTVNFDDVPIGSGTGFYRLQIAAP